MTLIDPASKVSVPPTVVILTRSATPERVKPPLIICTKSVVVVSTAITPENAQVFPEWLVKTKEPVVVTVAAPKTIRAPAVEDTAPTEEDCMYPA